jgi:hypothetical protein
MRVADQHAQDAAAVGQVADLATAGLVDPHGDEALELLVGGVEDAEGAVPGAGLAGGGLGDAREHPVEVELRDEAAPEVEKLSQSLVTGV